MHKGHQTQLHNIEVELSERLGRPVTDEEIKEAYRLEMRRRRQMRKSYPPTTGDFTPETSAKALRKRWHGL